VIAALLPIAASACRPNPSGGDPVASRSFARVATANPTGCVERFDPATDYFPDKATFESARQVSVSYHGHYKVMTVTFLGFTDSPEYRSVERYLLVQCGTPAPPLTDALAGAQILSIPAKTVTVTNNEDLGLMIALGLRDQIKSVGSRAIYDEELWNKFRAGRLPVTFGWGTSEIHLEWMLDLKPDVVLVGAYQSQAALNMQRVRDLGIQTLPSLSRIEALPLGRAEWLKAVAAVFNREATANAIYKEAADGYRALSSQARGATRRPRAFWASTYASGEWTVARNSFQARLLEDAGAVNPFADAGPTVPMKAGPELIVDRGGDSEYWITENGTVILEDGTSRVPGTPLDALRAARANHVYDPCKPLRVENQGCDYYQTGTHRPDLVLKDLVWLFHPELVEGHQPYFLKQLPPVAGRRLRPVSIR
jgi:iron complex transport system substrate-binding protein